METNLNLNFGNIKKRERNALIALMEEFRDCVSSSMKDLGRTNINRTAFQNQKKKLFEKLLETKRSLLSKKIME